MAKLYSVYCVILSFFATDLFTSNNGKLSSNKKGLKYSFVLKAGLQDFRKLKSEK